MTSANFVREDPSSATNFAVCVKGLPFTPQNIVGTALPASPPSNVAVAVPPNGCGAVPGTQAEIRFIVGTTPAAAGDGYFLIN